MPDFESYVDKLKGLFSRISEEEAETLFEHLSRAWKSEELVPQPEGYILIPMKRIEPPEEPIRGDLGDLEGLVQSVDREDLLQPICVRPLDEEWRKFEPVIGLRRYHAFRELGRKRIPAYIREISPEDAAMVALEENRFRKDLEPAEMLDAISRLRERGYTQENIAKIAKMSQGQVSAYLRVPSLPEEIRDSFFRDEISLEHVRVLLGLGDGEMRELFARIVDERMSVKDAQDIARLMKGELEPPEFLDAKEFERLLGRELNYRESGRGATLTLRAEDRKALEDLLSRLTS